MAIQSLAGLSHLKMLHLSNNQVITNAGLAAFHKHTLNGVPNINAAGILNLKNLNVKKCNQFDVYEVNKIASVFIKIQKISFN